jgi:hypothetical protein
MAEEKNSNPSDQVEESEVEVDLEELAAGVHIDVDLQKGKNRLIVRVRPRQYIFSL